VEPWSRPSIEPSYVRVTAEYVKPGGLLHKKGGWRYKIVWRFNKDEKFVETKEYTHLHLRRVDAALEAIEMLECHKQRYT
jgi:hypothetical protein